jgi:predicted XRE-type DNA-binding protein
MKEIMKAKQVTKGSIFDDLGFSKEEAVHLKLKTDLMLAIREYIKNHELTQVAAAEQLGVAQPQISRLLKGKISLFTIDRLLTMLSRINIKVEWRIVSASVSTQPTLKKLLLGSPKEKLAKKEEDHQWLNSKLVGKEAC